MRIDSKTAKCASHAGNTANALRDVRTAMRCTKYIAAIAQGSNEGYRSKLIYTTEQKNEHRRNQKTVNPCP